MKRFKSSCLAGLSLLSLAHATHAGPLEEKSVPAAAKWVIHVDSDAITKTQTWAQLEPKLKANPQYVRKLAELERLFKVKLPTDLHDITLFGATATKQDVVILIRATFSQERVKDLLSFSPTYEEKQLEGHTVYGWDDNGEARFGAFVGTDRLLVAESQQNVVDALNVIGGKSEAIKNSALTAGVQQQPAAGVMIYLAGEQIATLAQQAGAKNPVVGQLSSAWISFTEDAKGVLATSEVTTMKEEVAANVAKTVEGFKAMLSFADPDDANAASLAELTQTLTAKAEGKRVVISWPVSNERVSALLDQYVVPPTPAPAK